MKKYDLIVIGSGCGMNIVEEALAHDMEVALVDKGPLGGTCPNTGCIPSKILIHPADRVIEALEAEKLGIKMKVEKIDFKSVMGRMRYFVSDNQKHMREGIKHATGLDFYDGEGHFVADYTIEVNGETIKGDKIVISSGSRPSIPPLKGLESVNYLTNESLLLLEEPPSSLIIIGGGYIAAEYGHFFAAMGTKVTILEMADRLVLSEEPEVSRLLQEELSKRMEVHTKALVQEVTGTADGIAVLTGSGDKSAPEKYTASSILIAVGRRSNADILKVEKTGVEVNERGWIRVNEFLETNKKNIYAVGDANGQQMFTHVANREAMLVAEAIVHNNKVKMDYSAAPHAVYSHPQIASVGITEEVAKKNHKILVGRASYFDVAQGEAMLEKKGFAKAIVDADSDKILGFHIIGPFAPILIQEVINAMASGEGIGQIGRSMHIHPSITELIPRVLSDVR
jgi:mycothione reductase